MLNGTQYSLSYLRGDKEYNATIINTFIKIYLIHFFTSTVNCNCQDFKCKLLMYEKKHENKYYDDFIRENLNWNNVFEINVKCVNTETQKQIRGQQSVEYVGYFYKQLENKPFHYISFDLQKLPEKTSYQNITFFGSICLQIEQLQIELCKKDTMINYLSNNFFVIVDKSLRECVIKNNEIKKEIDNNETFKTEMIRNSQKQISDEKKKIDLDNKICEIKDKICSLSIDEIPQYDRFLIRLETEYKQLSLGVDYAVKIKQIEKIIESLKNEKKVIDKQIEHLEQTPKIWTHGHIVT